MHSSSQRTPTHSLSCFDRPLVSTVASALLHAWTTRFPTDRTYPPRHCRRQRDGAWPVAASLPAASVKLPQQRTENMSQSARSAGDRPEKFAHFTTEQG